MWLGAHASIAGGFDKCIDRIVDLGGNCLMTFASSPRTMQTKSFSPQEVSLYLKKKKEHTIGPHFFHGIYLINLATNKPDYLKVCQDSLVFYQQFAALIGAVGTIFHLGSHQGRGLESVFSQVTSSLDSILSMTPTGVKLILENSAGHTGVIGDRLEDLARITQKVRLSDRLGICLDTQHAFASGIPLTHLLDSFENFFPLSALSAIHLNDSTTDFSSRRDRHANWGEGKIPPDDLRHFLADPRLRDIPLILEVPGQNHSGPRRQDLDYIKEASLTTLPIQA